ncbi:hypothetical protein BURKHO8Y_40067 [Burkholderia sp. 8Y]|nr:hypothetical protein BURKHO8Y_40067 [Burkholderia sp. 8Y]
MALQRRRFHCEAGLMSAVPALPAERMTKELWIDVLDQHVPFALLSCRSTELDDRCG